MKKKRKEKEKNDNNTGLVLKKNFWLVLTIYTLFFSIFGYNNHQKTKKECVSKRYTS